MSREVRVMFGGTFDPFHLGHEAICQSILEHRFISELRLIPCAKPALKNAASASEDDRLAMLIAWRERQTEAERIVIDDQEMRRQGVSYTAETARKLKGDFPNVQWIFALGADAWNSLNRWQDAEWLKRELSFWVFQRTGDASPHVRTDMMEAKDLQALCSEPGHYLLDDAVNIPLASSALRGSERSGLLAQTPESVAGYIKQRGLY